MALTLYDTARRAKRVFTPLDPVRVGMYVCGPTVYDYAHVGNARPVVVFDVLCRLLRRAFGTVTYVRNITDVDDKINAAASDSGEPIEAITARTTAAFHEDMAALNALAPDVEPRATGHIAEMIAMIEKLVAAGHAYAAEGHVLFHVPSMPGYGALSGHNREELIAGARVEVAPYKRDPADFVLWKPSPPGVPGWDSPWGRGRPGWHIECSAMSEAHLGVTFDIHGGGQDLIFPHHENEIAQSTCAHGGTPFVGYWLHNGYVTVEGEKMSKSVGNILTVRELLCEVPGEAIRLALLGTHYRHPLDFTREGLRQAKRTLDRWYRAVDEVQAAEDLPEPFIAALEDDLNTPQAIAELHSLHAEIRGPESGERQVDLRRSLRAGGNLLGLLEQEAREWFSWRRAGDELDESAVADLIGRRTAAREAKDFVTADSIRAELAAQGVVLEDGPQGTTWRRAG